MTEKKKLLIADDDTFFHQLFEDIFAKDFKIVHAYDGAEALMLAVQHRPDLILLDIMMPFLDGRMVCKKIKENPVTAGIKIIMVTAKDEQHDRLVGFEVGADDYVAKTVGPEYLSNMIKRMLE